MNTSAPMLAEKLRFLVDGKFVQQSALADACGVSHQAVTGWKRTGRIAKKHLAVIADMSGVTVEWLLSPTRRAMKPWSRCARPSRAGRSSESRGIGIWHCRETTARIWTPDWIGSSPGMRPATATITEKATQDAPPARVYCLDQYRQRRGE